MYGNNYAENPESTRLLPFILSKITSNFNYADSKFVVSKGKDGTARIQMWNALKIPAVYTMEASFCGADSGPNKDYHFTQANYMESGKALCLSLLVYCDIKVLKTLNEIDRSNYKKNEGTPYKDQFVIDYQKINRTAVIKELIGSKKLLYNG